jgi:hypothetical protein
MYDPNDPRVLLTWTDRDLQPELPRAEDEHHEYKSSATTDGDLGNKLARAASAFWNSGGGVFIAGVDGRGEPDGGLSNSVGRQARRDWIDQAVAQVTPRATYVVHAIEDNGAGLNIGPGNAVYLIGFGESEIGPHMAPDHRYYIRAGAHTIQASHFIIEAIRARRGLTRPLLRSTLRQKPGNQRAIQLGIVALSDAPALNVEITMEPLPPFLEQLSADRFPLQVPVISAQVPFFFDFDLPVFGRDRPCVELHLKYHDIAGREYEATSTVDVERQMGPVLLGTTETEEIKRQLDDIEKALRGVTTAIGKNETHLRDIARKLR